MICQEWLVTLRRRSAKRMLLHPATCTVLKFTYGLLKGINCKWKLIQFYLFNHLSSDYFRDRSFQRKECYRYNLQAVVLTAPFRNLKRLSKNNARKLTTSVIKRRSFSVLEGLLNETSYNKYDFKRQLRISIRCYTKQICANWVSHLRKSGKKFNVLLVNS